MHRERILLNFWILGFIGLCGCKPSLNPKPSMDPLTVRNSEGSKGGKETLTLESVYEDKTASTPHPRDKFKLWREGPNFDTDMPQTVVAVKGEDALLACRVFDRGNKTISWIRHHDLHILTVGRYTYTGDNRYGSLYNSDRDEWILKIKYVRARDRGRYECQISTQPVRSFFVQLDVVDALPSPPRSSSSSSSNSVEAAGLYYGRTEKSSQQNSGNSDGTKQNENGLHSGPRRRNDHNLMILKKKQEEVLYPKGSGIFLAQDFETSQGNPGAKAKIIGGDADIYVDVGSMLNLTCVVEHSADRPAFIIWYHGDKTIDYSSRGSGGEISVVTSAENKKSSTKFSSQDEKSQLRKIHAENLQSWSSSTLLISKVEASDSGKYSCQPSNADLASVAVHIIDGEHQAAIHTNSATSLGSANHLLLSLVFGLIIIAAPRSLLRQSHYRCFFFMVSLFYCCCFYSSLC